MSSEKIVDKTVSLLLEDSRMPAVAAETVDVRLRMPEQSELFKKGKTLDDHKKYDEAFLYFAGGKEKGDPWCINALGKYYEEGRGGLQKNPERALKLISRAAAMNLPTANFYLGIHHLLNESDGSTEDAEKGIGLVMKAAALDDPDALYFLSLCYMAGKSGVPKDTKKGREYIIRAAKLNQPVAMNHLSAYHLNEICNLPNDTENRMGLVVKTAELDESAALYGFGLLYLDGMHGLPNDTEKGTDLVARAAQAEGVVALTNLARYFLEGKYGLPKDERKGIELLTKAAEQGHPKALANLGRYYLGGKYGLPRDAQKGIELLTQAAELRGPDALNSLGKAFLDGRHSVPKDIRKGLELLARAAEMKGTDALADLGKKFLEGQDGVPKNPKKGIELLTTAAELNHLDAIYDLGGFYERGTYVEQNFQTALAFYKKAKELGKDGLESRIYNLENSPDLAITPADLVQAYEKNEIAADVHYQGKTVRMNGVVSVIGKNSAGNVCITLSMPEDLSKKSGKLFGKFVKDVQIGGVFGSITVFRQEEPEKPKEVQCLFDKERIRDLFALNKGDSATIQAEVKGMVDGIVVLEHSWVVHGN